MGWGAGVAVGLEAVEYAPCVEVEQAEVRRAAGGEGEVDDVVGGEDFVFVEHADQPPVAWGEAAGEPGVVLGGVTQPRNLALMAVAAERALGCGVGDHGGSVSSR
jgi:hypothetical protein